MRRLTTVLRQLEQTIGAEVYWQTVVTRGYSEEARSMEVNGRTTAAKTVAIALPA